MALKRFYMGTEETRRNKIEKMRNILIKGKDKGILEKKLIAIMMMDGHSKRNIKEIIQSFIDLGEIKITEREGEKVLIYE
jgi:hypothetical protein